MDIRPASRDLWPVMAEFFGSTPTGRWCWCQFWRKPGSNWTNTTADENRDDLRSLVGRDPAPGLVALRDGEAIGWVGLGLREDFGRLARSRTLPQLPGEAVWVVVCFVVARKARRTGVAAALLEAAVEYAGAHGARLVEAYPADTGGNRMPSASAYTGTLGMFEKAGFEVAAPTTSRASGGIPRVVVRREV